MAKSQNWSFKDLEQKGLVQNEDGTFSRVFGEKVVTRKSSSQLYSKEEIVEPPHNDIPLKEDKFKSVLTIQGLIPGLNGDKGLMRSHWATVKKMKETYSSIISNHLISGKVKRHSGAVQIEYIGYKSILMDWDNFCSSFKHIGDALVDCQIITDDNPSIVHKFLPNQIKCKRESQKVVIIITDI